MTLPTRTLAALKALAKDREIPQTELLRRIVDDYLERAISLERAHDRILGPLPTRDPARDLHSHFPATDLGMKRQPTTPPAE